MGFGEELRRRLDGSGVTLTALATECGLTVRALQNILAGTEPRPDNRAAILAACRRMARRLSPEEQSGPENSGVDALAADHQLLTALGATGEDIARLRDAIGSKWAATVVLAALLGE